MLKLSNKVKVDKCAQYIFEAFELLFSVIDLSGQLMGIRM